jgi:hypothetical protein
LFPILVSVAKKLEGVSVEWYGGGD